MPAHPISINNSRLPRPPDMPRPLYPLYIITLVCSQLWGRIWSSRHLCRRKTSSRSSSTRALYNGTTDTLPTSLELIYALNLSLELLGGPRHVHLNVGDSKSAVRSQRTPYSHGRVRWDANQIYGVPAIAPQFPLQLHHALQKAFDELHRASEDM